MLDVEYKMYDEEIMVDVEIIFFFKNRFYNMYCLYNFDLKII